MHAAAVEVQDRHVLITAGVKRLGRALSETLLKKGARLTAHWFASEKEAAALQASSSSVQTVRADLRDLRAVQTLANEAQKRFGPVDILINSASDFSATHANSCTPELWEDIIRLNLRAPFFLAQACFPPPRMRQGCLINLCDIHVSRPIPRHSVYAASKGGLWTLTRMLAKEWAPHIRVCSVSPGAVLPPEGFTKEQLDRAAQRTALGRLGTAQDVVEAVLFVIQNDYITGFDLRVDGGAVI